MQCYKYRQQRGIALLMAMLVVVIATVIAVSLVHEQSLSIRKTAHIRNTDTALMYSLGLEDYARLFLQKDFRDSRIDHAGEDWGLGIPVLPIEGGFLSGTMEDAQSRLNLNSVLQQENEDRLRALCNNLDLSPVFISALKDWIDADPDVVDADGAEDDYYTNLDPPYRSANRMMTDISELLLIKGMDTEIYNKLKPFITVLPASANLNINTIPAEIYQVLDSNLDPDKFISERETEPFTSLEDYNKRMNHVLPNVGLSVTTEYFLASGQITLGTKTLFVNTLIHRDNRGATRILSRKLGEFS
jgi:general secretion pathway protein K